MPSFRAHIIKLDLSVIKWNFQANNPTHARELASKRIKAHKLDGAKISKVKLIREEHA
jgi:hypothetical protein